MGKIKNFTDLNTWKEGHRLVLLIYELVKKFPKNEEFALKNQIIRAAVSVTSNIAEGFGRRNLKEKIQFYYLAQSSLTEVQNQLIVSRDVGYLDDREFRSVLHQTVMVHKLLTGLIKSLKK